MKDFLIGAAGYPLLELLWRGRTHCAMGLAGGAAMVLIRRISRTRLRPAAGALLCGAGITAIEYACGRIWNRDFAIWDYRRMPLNYRGQICLPYTALWCVLGGAALHVMRRHGRASARA